MKANTKQVLLLQLEIDEFLAEWIFDYSENPPLVTYDDIEEFDIVKKYFLSLDVEDVRLQMNTIFEEEHIDKLIEELKKIIDFLNKHDYDMVEIVE